MNTERIAKTLYEMTELLDDWDDDGGKAISKELARHVEGFLFSIKKLAEHWDRELLDPTLSPGLAETVDIHWKTENFELLVNVKNGDGLCSFYGERPEDSHVMKGGGYTSLRLASDFLRFILRMPID
jgi:hypothetical protein